ncbi:hypothetical protein AYI68_g6657 [Smittium mucronatum]|uniref:G protein gamma domain-containing protein n=1 Tax=Smittium mucronatum TaxID=133383 RepID=A0A1R0GQX1_9FUNG|nr:hypothetical protein AYI68_g6825 [Smittium mucronatum]OLY79276.1 hypothetical protein AYI68_g6657 [Smittium mucronatum]
MSERKQKRIYEKILENNAMLQAQLDLNMIPVSEACQDLILYTQQTPDSILDMVKGKPGNDPFATRESSGCACLVS